MKYLVLLVSFLIAPLLSIAMTTGIVSFVGGSVTHSGKSVSQSGTIITINDEDTIEAGDSSGLNITLLDGSQLVLFEQTHIRFEHTSENQSQTIRLITGDFWVYLNQPDSTYQFNVNKFTVTSNNASLRLSFNEPLNKGSIVVGSNTVSIKSPGGTSKTVTGPRRVSFSDETLDDDKKELDRIQMSAGQSRYFLPKSGEIPVVIRATLPLELRKRQHIPAFVISSNPNLAVASPLIDFYQEEIEIIVTALGAGNAQLFLVTPPTPKFPGFEGMVPISVFKMKDTKLMKIKTSRGTINIKLAPKDR